MSEFFIWYFNLSALQAIEFFFKALLLMILIATPFITAWGVYKYVTRQKQIKVLSQTIRSHREQPST